MNNVVTGWVIIHPDGKYELSYFNAIKFTTKLDNYKSEVSPEFWRQTYRPNCQMKKMRLAEILPEDILDTEPNKELTVENLVVTARNLRFIMNNNNNKEFFPEIEVILTVVDKNIEFVGSNFVNVEKTKTLRFTVNPEGARVFSKSLSEWADEADQKCTELTSASEQ